MRFKLRWYLFKLQSRYRWFMIDIKNWFFFNVEMRFRMWKLSVFTKLRLWWIGVNMRRQIKKFRRKAVFS